MNLSEKLSHLPKHKQEEIAKAMDIILEVANPEKVILFGSFAKGKWVDDITVEGGVTYHYQSDFDFLVVTKDNSLKEFELKSKIENKALNRVNGIVNVLVHSIDYINEGLNFGQYFFKQIVEEGIILFDLEKSAFISPTKLPPKVLKDRAVEYFGIWFPMASEFLIDAKAAYSRNSLRVSNFHLHQALEHFYASLLLVFTGYKPKSHNLQNLRDYSKNLSFELYTIFYDPEDSELESKIFKCLKKGYIEARYHKDYFIEPELVKEMIHKIDTVKSLVEKLCKEKINKLSLLV